MSGPSRISQEIAGAGLFAVGAQLAHAVRALSEGPYPPKTFFLKSFEFLPNFKNTKRFHLKLFQKILKIKVTYSCLTVCGSALKIRL